MIEDKRLLMRRSLVINLVSILIIFVTSYMVITALTSYGSATTSDSLGYMDIAENIKNGNGTFVTDFSLDNVKRHLFKEKRSWPPLYPALLSLTAKDSSDVSAVSNISKILFFILIITFSLFFDINS